MSESAEPETFSFKNVKKGAPIRADDFPKLPPRAMKAMLAVLRDNGVDPMAKLNMNDPATLVAMNEVAIVLVHATLKRMVPSLTLAQVAEDEDFDEVVRAFKAVQERNPSFFPKGKGKDEAAEAESEADPQ